MVRFGCHAEPTVQNMDLLYKNNLTCVQFMPGGRLSYNCPKLVQRITVCCGRGIVPVFHAPLCCYAVSDKENILSATKAYIRRLDSEVKQFKDLWKVEGLFNLVIHVGSLQNHDEGYRKTKLKEFCSWFLAETSNLRLCLENDAGSKNGNRVGSVSLLREVVRDIDDNRICLCIDTNHAWGDNDPGFDVTNMNDWEDIAPYVRVIHLNCIPSICTRGAHLDRHSTYLIEDSGDSVSWIQQLYQRAFNAMYITERDSIELSLKDYTFLRGGKNE